MKRWGLLLALLIPAPAYARPYEQWARQAKVPTPAHVTVVEDANGCAESREACTDPSHDTVYVSPTATQPRLTFYHELGHQFDYKVLTDTDRAAFLLLIKAKRPVWRSSPNSPHEQFAEAYSKCAYFGDAIPQQFSNDPRADGGYGYTPWPRLHRRVCAVIRRASGWFMRPSSGPLAGIR